MTVKISWQDAPIFLDKSTQHSLQRITIVDQEEKEIYEQASKKGERKLKEREYTLHVNYWTPEFYLVFQHSQLVVLFPPKYAFFYFVPCRLRQTPCSH